MVTTRYFSIDKARRDLDYNPRVRWDDDGWDEILHSYGLETKRERRKRMGGRVGEKEVEGDRKDVNDNL